MIKLINQIFMFPICILTTALYIVAIAILRIFGDIVGAKDIAKQIKLIWKVL